jgi:hypothetical protein
VNSQSKPKRDFRGALEVLNLRSWEREGLRRGGLLSSQNQQAAALKARERELAAVRAELAGLRAELEAARRREESMAKQLLSLDVFKVARPLAHSLPHAHALSRPSFVLKYDSLPRFIGPLIDSLALSSKFTLSFPPLSFRPLLCSTCSLLR